MHYTIDIKTQTGESGEFTMQFYMITEESTAVYTCPYMDHLDEYRKVVYEGFPKIQTMKGFIRFCGWLESGRPKTFKLKELEYITRTLSSSERFLGWNNDPSLKHITDIITARDRQIIILKNATKEIMDVRLRHTRLSKDKEGIYLEPQQGVVLLGGEVCRIIGGKEK